MNEFVERFRAGLELKLTLWLLNFLDFLLVLVGLDNGQLGGGHARAGVVLGSASVLANVDLGTAVDLEAVNISRLAQSVLWRVVDLGAVLVEGDNWSW